MRPAIRRYAVTLSLALVVVGCGTPTTRAPTTSTSSPTAAPTAASPAPSTSAGRYYKDDGPGDNPPDNLDGIADAIPRVEPLHRFANRPYTVLGREYVPATSIRRYRERGVASWYGRKFHGQKTSTGETYDMYAMTAAHPTLPLPSYARVTNVANGKSIVVRVNDRGPFLHDRIIDLSYAAAHKIGIAMPGSGLVEVESIVPTDLLIADAVAPLPPVAAITTATSTVTADSKSIPMPPVMTTIAGFIVQLGAFANYANAQAFLAHVQNQLTSAQVEAKVRQAGGLFRVYVGPYPDRDEARRVGERLENAFGFATMVARH